MIRLLMSGAPQPRPVWLAAVERLRWPVRHMRDGRDVGATVHGWERRGAIPGPASVAIEMMLAGAEPPGGWASIISG